MVNHDSCIPISDDALHFLTIAQQGNNPLANQCNTHVREDNTDLEIMSTRLLPPLPRPQPRPHNKLLLSEHPRPRGSDEDTWPRAAGGDTWPRGEGESCVICVGSTGAGKSSTVTKYTGVVTRSGSGTERVTRQCHLIRSS